LYADTIRRNKNTNHQHTNHRVFPTRSIQAPRSTSSFGSPISHPISAKVELEVSGTQPFRLQDPHSHILPAHPIEVKAEVSDTQPFRLQDPQSCTPSAPPPSAAPQAPRSVARRVRPCLSPCVPLRPSAAPYMTLHASLPPASPLPSAQTPHSTVPGPLYAAPGPINTVPADQTSRK
jgi:hypothetical protein